MDCRTAEWEITRFIQNELSDEEEEDFLAHIRDCALCRHELETNYFIVEGLRLLDSDSDDFDVQGTMEQAIRAAYQRLRWGRGRKIAEYAVSTMVAMSVIVILLLELRICFF